MIFILIKSKFLLKQFQKEQILMRCVLFSIVTLEIKTPCIQITYQSFISGKLLISKVVHTSRSNR